MTNIVSPQIVNVIVVDDNNIQVIAEGIQGPPGPTGPSSLTINAFGNTTGQSSSGTFAGSNFPIEGAGNVSVGMSAGSLIISGAGSGGGGGGVAISAGIHSTSTGTVIFSNANGLSFGMDTTGNITGSYTVPTQSNQTEGWYAISNTTGGASSSTFDARSISVEGAGGISVGMTNGSIVISGQTTAAQTVQTIGAYAVGNTTGQSSSSTIDARSLSFDGANGISVGMSAGSVVISGQTTASQTNQSLGWYATGNTTQNSSITLDARSLTVDDLGGITAGFSNGSIQISGPQTVAQTAQTIGLYGVGNTTQNSSTTLDARTISFDGLGGISVGYSNGSVQISGPQTAAQTAQTLGLYATGNTTQNSSTTLDARTLSFDFLGAATGGFSNGSIQVSAPVQTNQTQGYYAIGNTTNNSSTTLDARTLSLGGYGGVTVGYSNGTIQISGAQTSAQTNQTIGFYATGNTTQNSSTTLDARTVSYNFLGMATGGFSNGSINVSVSMAANQTKRQVTFDLDGSGSAIASGGTWYLAAVPYAGTITSWNIVADVSGSIVIDVWKANAAVPTVANTITASSLPTLSSAQSAFSGSISGWTTSVAAGDVFAFHVNSAATVTKVSLTIEITGT